MDTRTAPRPSTVRPRKWRLPAVMGAVVTLTAATVAVGQFAFAATAFSANFESGGTNGWSKSGGTWAVVADGSQALRQSNATSENARIFAGDTSWADYTVSARVKPISLGSGGFAGLLARAKGSTTFYRLALLPGNQVQLQAVNGSRITQLGSSSRTVSNGTWYTLSLTVAGGTISGSVNGSSVGSGSDSTAATGRIGLQTAYSTASFDDVVVTTGGTPTPSTTSSSPRPSNPAPSNPVPSSSAPSNPGGGTAPAWPTPSGSVGLPNGTITVSGTLDGGMRRYCCIGDGGQSESQDPVFELAPGATLKNVIIGAPAGDGVHCTGDCTLQNVWWEDVGEDAATFMAPGTNFTVIGGGARSGTDKVFQHNGGGTLRISNFYVEGSGKLYRACGNCSVSYQRHVVIDNIVATSTKVLAGINTNWGDTARFSRITILNDSSHKTVICDKYQGVPKGSEPTHIGSGADGVNCFYSESDITWK